MHETVLSHHINQIYSMLINAVVKRDLQRQKGHISIFNTWGFQTAPKPVLVMVNLPLSSLASSCLTPFSDYSPLDDISKDRFLVLTLTLLLLDESVKL